MLKSSPDRHSTFTWKLKDSLKNKLTEGIDYYYNEDGLMVLTAQFHLDRGFCCGNGCLHCPYEYERVPEVRRSLLLKRRSEEENDK